MRLCGFVVLLFVMLFFVSSFAMRLLRMQNAMKQTVHFVMIARMRIAAVFKKRIARASKCFPCDGIKRSDRRPELASAFKLASIYVTDF